MMNAPHSEFLAECVRAGLDSAIVHASRILPVNRIPDEQRQVALDLVYDRRHPDLADPAKVARLLRPADVGVELTEEMQLVPEQSTDALVVHHPEAKYFAT